MPRRLALRRKRQRNARVQGLAPLSSYPKLEAEFTETVQRPSRQPLTVPVPGASGSPAATVVIEGWQLANLLVALALSGRRIPERCCSPDSATS